MEVEAAVKKKKVLENEILDLLVQFQNETGLTPISVDIGTVGYNIVSEGGQDTILTNVEIKVEL